MNSVSSRLKAIAVTALFFALSGLVLLGIIWGLSRAPFPFPGQMMFEAYRPGTTISVLMGLRLVVVLSAVFLVANGIVLALSSAYLDSMIGIFADVLLMTMAAIAGVLAGFWVWFRFMGQSDFIDMGFIQSALIAPAIVFAVSLIQPHWARSSLILRTAVVLVLLVAGPVLLVSQT